MCENYEGPPESRKTQVDGYRTTAELDSSLFNGKSPVQISERTRALHCDAWKAFFDKDGRMVNESALRKAVFKGNYQQIISRRVYILQCIFNMITLCAHYVFKLNQQLIHVP